ncbi:hypothetical protein [Streptomyces sp. NBC_01462]|uniref:hypothetical protein n=1 Tax=Streptomyces sp. NBC_01462 TaxID=2903876 RepID=UPI002E364AC8|nr:hypothetical protein [Streptomyces sp. NBC_01462]
MRKKLDAPSAAARKKEGPLIADQIRKAAERLGNIPQRVHTVGAKRRDSLY